MDALNFGYHGWSMSKRAHEAYDDGEMPKSKWTRAAMLAAIRDYVDTNYLVPLDEGAFDMKKDDLFRKYFYRSSWHHCSKFCNEVDFYALDEYAVEDACRPMTREEREAERAAELEAIRRRRESRTERDER